MAITGHDTERAITEGGNAEAHGQGQRTGWPASLERRLTSTYPSEDIQRLLRWGTRTVDHAQFVHQPLPNRGQTNFHSFLCPNTDEPCKPHLSTPRSYEILNLAMRIL
jgi:hypothetical protein